MEIYPNVHLIEKARGCNCYLITRPELSVIDTGISGQAGIILDYISGLGFNPPELKRIFLTHHDIDHISSAAELQKLTGAEVCMHPADADCVLGKAKRRPFWKNWLSSLAAALGKLRPPEINCLVRDSQAIGPIQIIHTPGHSSGSISLKYGPVLFVGDLLRGGSPLKEAFFLADEDRNLVQTSIRKISELDVEVICPGHGKVVFNAGKKLRELVACWAV